LPADPSPIQYRMVSGVRNRAPLPRCSAVLNEIGKNVKWEARRTRLLTSPANAQFRSWQRARGADSCQLPWEAWDVHVSLLPLHEMRRAYCVGRVGGVYVSAAPAGASASAASEMSILRIRICAGTLLRDGKRRAAGCIRVLDRDAGLFALAFQDGVRPSPSF
jgi:hypothetical protein